MNCKCGKPGRWIGTVVRCQECWAQTVADYYAWTMLVNDTSKAREKR